MRVLIAPDKFAGTLTAVEAAEAIAEGWRRRKPADSLELAPMADGGPGFIDVLHAALGGELLPVVVTGPLGAKVPAVMLAVDGDDGLRVYLESAQACGLHLMGSGQAVAEQTSSAPSLGVISPAERATSYGVGELLEHALQAGAREIIVGLGGSGVTDGGAGLLSALGATSQVDLSAGPLALRDLQSVNLVAVRSRWEGVRIIAASDVDNPLTGLFGAAKTYGPQKGMPEDRIAVVDQALERWSEVTDRRLSLKPGAGAAGGVGFALMLLGASGTPGIDLVAQLVGLADKAANADLVITGEGAFDFSTRSGKVPYGVAEIANNALRPCVALAGAVLVGSREMRALGVEAAYSTNDLVGEDASMADPAGSLAALAERVARSWPS